MKKFLTTDFLLRTGLGIIFLANSLVAFFAPSEFVELIENSFIINFLPVSSDLFVPLVIGLNDGIVALFLFSGMATRRIAMWAFLWLIGVMIVIGEPLDILEHAGLLFMALALILGDNYFRKKI